MSTAPNGAAAYVLNFNNLDDTRECVRSLLAARPRGPEVRLVDNGSTNDSSERVARELGVGLLRTGSNLGYAGGMNWCLRHAREAGVARCLLVSTDVVFPPGSVEALVDCAAAGEFAVMAPVHVSEGGGEVRSAGKRLALRRGDAWHDTVVRGEAPYEVEATDGAVLLVDVGRVLAAGGFEERYFMYWEDLDLSARLRSAGQRVLLCPRSRVVHAVSGTAGRDSVLQTYYSARNRLLFLRAHAGAGTALMAMLYQGVCAMPVFLAHLIRMGQRSSARALVLGTLDGLLRPGEAPPGGDPLRQRRP